MSDRAVLRRALFHAGLDTYATLAVLVVLAEGGDGEDAVAIESTVFEAAMGVKDPRTVRRAIVVAENLEILRVERPGYGRPNRYRIDVGVLFTGLPRGTFHAHLEETDPNPLRSTSHAHLEGDGPVENADRDLSRQTSDAHLEDTRQTSDAHLDVENPSRHTSHVPLSSSSRGSSKKRDEQKRAREEQCGLDLKTGLTIDGDEFDGFRSALSDYFKDRVETDRQWGYLNTVRTWLQGSPGAPKGMFDVEEKERKMVIAQALNELLELTAEDERKTFKSARGQAGTTNILRAKIEYLLSRGGDHGNGNRNSGSAHRGARSAGGAGRGNSRGSAIGSNFTGFPEASG